MKIKDQLLKEWDDAFPPLNIHNFPNHTPMSNIQPLTNAAWKFDTNKPRMDLLDAEALEGLAAVLSFGAEKYAPNNWRKGMQYSRLSGALLRHLFAIQRGEDIDPESGLPHIDHVGCCWMFLSNYMKNAKYKSLDDRPHNDPL